MTGVVAPASSPHARRLSTPSWLDLRLVLGVVLVLASVLIGARVVSGASDTRGVLRTTRDLPAGSIVTADDLSVVQVQLPDRRTYLSTTGDAVGQQVQRPLSRGELVPAAALTKVAAQTTLIIALAAGAAPTMHPGQRIEVWVSSPACASVVLLADVTVQSVRADDGGSFSSGTGGQDVVVSVPPSVADRVIRAIAIDQVKLRAGVLIGHSATPDRPGDLAACASAASPAAGAPAAASPSR